MRAETKLSLQGAGSFLSAADCQKFIFIIDNISTAFAVAIMAKGQAIHCIYECKEITWRKADYVALFDFILSDVTFISKEVISVPHPYLRPSKTLLGRVVGQIKFARSLRKRHTLDSSRTYVSSIVSSLLIANKRHIKSILIDEGMSSLTARNRITFYGNRLAERLTIAIGERVLSFQFPTSTPQITLTNDPHPSVIQSLDYRDFDSRAFSLALGRLNALMDRGKHNVLVLLKGPSAGAAGHHDEADQYGDDNAMFNLRAIMAFMNQLPGDVAPTFFLKSHPSLGSSSGKLTKLINALESQQIVAFDALNHIDFDEASSLPAEGLLRYMNFEYVLALDATSVIWNVAYRGGVKCYMPLKDIVEFLEIEDSIHIKLYRLQDRINQLLGGHVHYYDIGKDEKRWTGK